MHKAWFFRMQATNQPNKGWRTKKKKRGRGGDRGGKKNKVSSKFNLCLRHGYRGQNFCDHFEKLVNLLCLTVHTRVIYDECLRRVLNKVYLQKILEADIAFRDESNNNN